VDGVRLVSRLITRTAVVLVTIARGAANGVRTAAALATSRDVVDHHESQGHAMSLPHSPRGCAR